MVRIRAHLPPVKFPFQLLDITPPRYGETLPGGGWRLRASCKILVVMFCAGD